MKKVKATIDNEKRSHQRISSKIPMQLIYKERSFHVTTSDLTSQGMGISSDSLTIPSGNLVDLVLQIDDDQWHINGLVIHVGGERMGILFRMPQPELESVLRSSTAVPHNSSTPTLIADELLKSVQSSAR